MLDANFMTAWETNFLLAEAAAKGLITAPAQTLYETAVAQAFEYWNTTLPVDYLTTTAAYAANGNDPIDKSLLKNGLRVLLMGTKAGLNIEELVSQF